MALRFELLRTLAPGFATFRFVTCLAGQVSCQVLTHSRNVANPWSLSAMLKIILRNCILYILIKVSKLVDSEKNGNF
ncbi:hypothetical protein EHO58_01565 [Leptospira selangorensis]|nr:hypothetical protein EHO58_01565 [Leptospira selangorensis]